MKAIKLSMMALAISVSGFTAYAQKTADEVIQKHIDAVGGIKNWDKVKSVKLVGSVSANGMDIPMTQTIVNGKGYRMDISVMGQNGYSIVSDKGGWQYMPFMGDTKAKELPAEQIKMSREKLDFKNSQLVDKSVIASSALDGKDTVNSVPCIKVKIKMKSGEDVVCYFDAATYYMVKQEMKLKINDEEQEMATTFSNFKKQPEGIVIPMTIGTPQGDVTFKTVEINKPVDDKMFKPSN